MSSFLYIYTLFSMRKWLFVQYLGNNSTYLPFTLFTTAQTVVWASRWAIVTRKNRSSKWWRFLEKVSKPWTVDTWETNPLPCVRVTSAMKSEEMKEKSQRRLPFKYMHQYWKTFTYTQLLGWSCGNTTTRCLRTSISKACKGNRKC